MAETHVPSNRIRCGRFTRDIYADINEMTGLRTGILVCCANKSLKSQYKLARCDDCHCEWHIECLDAVEGYDILDDLREYLRKKPTAHGSNLIEQKWWENVLFFCPRCLHVLAVEAHYKAATEQKVKQHKKRQKRYWKCDWGDGCEAEGYGGSGMKEEHIDRVHRGITWKCDNCKADLCNKGALTRHMKTCGLKPTGKVGSTSDATRTQLVMVSNPPVIAAPIVTQAVSAEPPAPVQ